VSWLEFAFTNLILLVERAEALNEMTVAYDK
jgi:hypothetical protein